jgi:GT2 family glycosyltransferase
VTVVFGSAFRNSSHGIVAYMNRIAEYAKFRPEDTVRVVAVEGDSTDNTRAMLSCEAKKRNISLDLRTHNHGKRVFGSTEDSERLKALSGVGNSIFDGVSENDDCLVYIESDLTWRPLDIDELVKAALEQRDNFDVIAPLVMAGKCFYDIWGYRYGGQRFSPFHPFHFSVDHKNHEISELDSAGSCLVMRTEVARKCRIRNDYALVGWCRDARSKGFRIGLLPSSEVRQA